MIFDEPGQDYLAPVMALIAEGKYDDAREELQLVPEDIRDEIRMSVALLTGTIL